MHPTEIYQPGPNELAITWQDGSESRIATRKLRLNCPCAECQSRRHMTSATYLPLLTDAATTIREIDLVGSSAIHIVWEDGHAIGIFPYPLIRQLAPPVHPSER